MTRDEIISMAREAGGRFSDAIVRDAWLPFLERFAALVAAREREGCAAVCQSIEDGENDACGLARECVAAIRARAGKDVP
jgi:hypothetical protein